jgi:hypothetical protein
MISRMKLKSQLYQEISKYVQIDNKMSIDDAMRSFEAVAPNEEFVKVKIIYSTNDRDWLVNHKFDYRQIGHEFRYIRVLRYFFSASIDSFQFY